jgi:hypothetical protein
MVSSGLGSFRPTPPDWGAIAWQSFQTDFRTCAPTQSPDGCWGAGAFVNLLATSDPITRGFEKTGEAF